MRCHGGRSQRHLLLTKLHEQRRASGCTAPCSNTVQRTLVETGREGCTRQGRTDRRVGPGEGQCRDETARVCPVPRQMQRHLRLQRPLMCPVGCRLSFLVDPEPNPRLNRHPREAVREVLEGARARPREGCLHADGGFRFARWTTCTSVLYAQGTIIFGRIRVR
jgi:hypothetical protein